MREVLVSDSLHTALMREKLLLDVDDVALGAVADRCRMRRPPPRKPLYVVSERDVVTKRVATNGYGGYKYDSQPMPVYQQGPEKNKRGVVTPGRRGSFAVRVPELHPELYTPYVPTEEMMTKATAARFWERHHNRNYAAQVTLGGTVGGIALVDFFTMLESPAEEWPRTVGIVASSVAIGAGMIRGIGPLVKVPDMPPLEGLAPPFTLAHQPADLS
ncbi:MAG TPA: hypothetical protein VMR45_05075 [Patescibacteria group bacterium]|nr:hypothetical protein [Patescibacteria group bacterium]